MRELSSMCVQPSDVSGRRIVLGHTFNSKALAEADENEKVWTKNYPYNNLNYGAIPR